MSVLDMVAGRYDPSTPAHFDYWFIRLGVEAVRGNIHPAARCLEMGCSTGLSTELLAPHVAELEVVEGSRENIARAVDRVGAAVRFMHARFEDFEPDHLYDDIVCASILEHVTDPVGLLSRVRGWLRPEGRLHVIVPNAFSLHRQFGVEMGLLPALTDLGEGDILLDHQRVYGPITIRRDLWRAGFDSDHPHDYQGLLLKPLPNREMAAWPEERIRAAAVIGRRYPDICGQLYLCVAAL